MVDGFKEERNAHLTNLLLRSIFRRRGKRLTARKTDVHIRQKEGKMSEDMPGVWSPDRPVPVAREIRLNLLGTSGYVRGGTVVVERPVPDKTTTLDAFVHGLLPGCTIEHMGRRSMLAMAGGSPGYANPSSIFFQVAHRCFERHHALALRPDVLMQMILHEIAVTVNLHPQEYRALFTTSSEKVRIEVRHDGLVPGNPNSPWDEAIALFHPELRARVPSTLVDDMLFPFSTDTMESQLARLITFQDAARQFYDYSVATMCGIPRIQLLGTADDWRALHDAAAKLSRTFGRHLDRYFQHLLPALAKLADQAAGEPQDDAFWSSAYKYESGSGTSIAGGWLTAFVNYVWGGRGSDRRLVEKDGRAYDWANPGRGYHMGGIDTGSVPSQVSMVDFTWNYMGHVMPMKFLGGVLGVDLANGCATPALSYGVVRA